MRSKQHWSVMIPCHRLGKILRRTKLFVGIMMLSFSAFSQISPGDLATPHAHLEGMDNCTKCHTLGAKVSNDKCLDCHKEIKILLDHSKGFHASPALQGKACTSCHSDHYGKNYDIVHLKKESFKHEDTGYKLEGKHATKDCKDCHQTKFITNPDLRKKHFTYLGLNGSCLSCHEDVHQKTLAANCQNCHNQEAFKPASKFDHNNAKYRLTGQHKSVPCAKCHVQTAKSDPKIVLWTGLSYQNCSDCHKDPHENKFGPNCSQCHTEESFKTIRNTVRFDHDKTGYPLEGKHVTVACKACHKVSITTALKHDHCTNCHQDYHKGQFTRSSVAVDCLECHNLNGFTPSSYSIEKHNEKKFKLDGSHLATPCLECHKKQNNWTFKDLGEKCSDCHQDIHAGQMDPKYYPNGDCRACHATTAWDQVVFDHGVTKFTLEGKHAKITCRSCHFGSSQEKIANRTFKRDNSLCLSCHQDPHHGQFQANPEETCSKCHGFTDWKPNRFNHDHSRFKLDGKHRQVACNKCHPKEKMHSFNTTLKRYHA
ncbi:MAG: hypothetical protein LWW85_10565 [Marinilabiliales bacterium]|nr:hypothetical protein [Marinilabiliales bacterium]